MEDLTQTSQQTWNCLCAVNLVTCTHVEVQVHMWWLLEVLLTIHANGPPLLLEALQFLDKSLLSCFPIKWAMSGFWPSYNHEPPYPDLSVHCDGTGCASIKVILSPWLCRTEDVGSLCSDRTYWSHHNRQLQDGEVDGDPEGEPCTDSWC